MLVSRHLSERAKPVCRTGYQQHVFRYIGPMLPDDADYYRARAIEERDMAQRANRENVAAIHDELARQYDALADQADLRPDDDLRGILARLRQLP